MKFTPHPLGTLLPPIPPPTWEIRKGRKSFILWNGREIDKDSDEALRILSYYGTIEE